MQEKLPGRPLGPIAESVLELLTQQGPLSALQIAEKLQLSRDIALKTCNRLLQRDRIRIERKVRMPGVNKPVACYATVRQVANTKSPLFQFFY